MDPNDFKARGQHGNHGCRGQTEPSPHDDAERSDFLRRLDEQIATLNQSLNQVINTLRDLGVNMDHLAQRWRPLHNKAGPDNPSEESDGNDADAEEEASEDDQYPPVARFLAAPPPRDREIEDKDDSNQFVHGQLEQDSTDESDDEDDSPLIYTCDEDSDDHRDDTVYSDDADDDQTSDSDI